MQWRMLMRRCPGRSMTIVGDLAQAGPTTTIRSWAEALDPFVRERFVHHRLTVNYRTTAEILESTRPLLAQIAPDQKLSQSIRNGEEPCTLTTREEHLASQMAELIADLAHEHPGELIGVIATTERAPTLQSAEWASTVTIVSASDARGLEFDTVIVIDPIGIQTASEAGIRDLYVAQTRATKRLVSVQVVESRFMPL
jgi:DNA helicase IV